MARKYSEIFSQIVKDQSDIVGHIVYGLYKDEKSKYIEHFKETNGRNPSDDELDLFHDISCQVDKVIKYRFIASNILRGFIDESLRETINQAEQDCVERHADILRDVISPLQPPSKKTAFLHGVVQSIAGAFVFALLVAAFMFIVTYKGADVPFVDRIPLTQDAPSVTQSSASE